jgi:hypothetical protein
VSQKLVTVAVVFDLTEAMCAQSALDAYGIQCFVADRHTIFMNWQWLVAYGGVRLMVFENDLHSAAEIIADRSMPSELESSSESFRQHPFLNSLLAALIIFEGVPLIPHWVRQRVWKVR